MSEAAVLKKAGELFTLRFWQFPVMTFCYLVASIGPDAFRGGDMTKLLSSLISATELRMSIPKFNSFSDVMPESALLINIPRLKKHLKAAEIHLKGAKEC